MFLYKICLNINYSNIYILTNIFFYLTLLLGVILFIMICRHYYITYYANMSGFDQSFLKVLLESNNYGYVIGTLTFKSDAEFISFKNMTIRNLEEKIKDPYHLLNMDIDFNTGNKTYKQKTIDNIVFENNSLCLNNLINKKLGPFLFIFDSSRNEFTMLISHYLCDGKKMVNDIIKIFVTDISTIKFVDYPKYIPIYFELYELEYILRHAFLIKTNLCLKKTNEKNKILPCIYYTENLNTIKEIKKKIKTDYKVSINFASVTLAKVVKKIYDNLDPDSKIKKTNIKVMVIVGFEGKGNNNFGLITVNIQTSLLSDLFTSILNIDSQLKKYASDSFISIEVLDNYIKYINQENSPSDYDLNFSSLQLPDIKQEDNYGCDKIKVRLYNIATPLYCFAISDNSNILDPKIQISLTVNTSELNISEFNKSVNGSLHL